MSWAIREALAPGVPTQVQYMGRPPKRCESVSAILSGKTGVPVSETPTPAAKESPITRIRNGGSCEDSSKKVEVVEMLFLLPTDCPNNSPSRTAGFRLVKEDIVLLLLVF